MLETIKKMLKWITQIILINYIHACTILLVSNDKNNSKAKNTQSKKICNLLLNNTGNVSKTAHDHDKVIFNFSSYRLNNHEK